MPFPSNSQFTPITVGGTPIFDLLGDESPVSTDIVGNSSFPAAFFAYDGTNVYFRLRLNGDPRNAQLTGFRNFAWGVLINTQGVPGTYDWLFNVDGLNNRVSLIQNTVKQVNSWNDPAEGTGGGNPNFSQAITNFDYARVTLADSSIGGDQDYFLDWFLPASTFFSFLGINETSLLRAVFFTSANINNYNKDSLRSAEGFSFTNTISNPVSPDQVDVRAELTVNKTLTSGPNTVLIGQQATWTGTVTVTNTGKSQATTIFLDDVLGPDLINSFIVNTVSQGLTAYNSSTKTLTWNVGNLAPGGTATLTFTLNGLYTASGIRQLNRVIASGFDSFTGGRIQSNTSLVTITAQAAASINGTIFDQTTGLVLPNATVNLLQGMTIVSTTFSNSNGIYTFTNVSPGNYTVQALRANYATNSVAVIASSGISTTANIPLTPLPSTISGNVSNGGPINSATVSLTNQEGIVIASTTTNVAGNYTFPFVSPGLYNVSVLASGFQSQVQSITVQPNQNYTVNFVLIANPGAITGEIRDAITNTVIPNAVIELLTLEGIFINSTSSNGAGVYSFTNLSPGTYLVRASATNYASSLVSSTVTAGNTTTTNLFLQQGPGAIQGTVNDSGSLALIPNVNIQVVNAQNIVVLTAVTNVNGQYTTDQLLPGSYTLIFTADGYSNETLGAIVTANSTSIVNAALSRMAGALMGNIQNPQGNPLSGASVSVFQNNVLIQTALTDANGNYMITGLAPDTNYSVVISTEGYSTFTAAATIINGQTTTLDAILNENPGNLTGIVIDSNNNPVAGANISVQLSTGSGIIIATTVTDSNGNYFVQGLAPENYSVVVTAPNLQSSTLGTTITSNVTSTLNFTLLPDPGSISGQITNAQTGVPINSANVQVRILDGSGAIVATVLTDSNGQYVFNQLAPGIYTIVVSAENFQSNAATIQVLSNQTASGNVALVPNPGQITGFVFNSVGGSPIIGATVNVINSVGALVTTVLTDQGGGFTVNGLAPDQYTLNVIAQNFQNGIIGTFVNSGQVTPVEIALVANPGSITGTVAPIISNTLVQLLDVTNLLIDSVLVGTDGSFSFQNLTPGIYTVIASAPNYSATPVGASVSANQTTNVSITMTPNPGSVSGSITDNLGNPITNAAVQVFDLNGILIATGFTSSEGNYTIGNIPSGSFTIVVTAPGYGQVTVGINVSPGEVLTGIDAVLVANPGSINGQITNQNTGTRIEGAVVSILDGSSQVPVSVTTTSFFGNYTVSDLAPGSYIVTASKPNFGTNQIGAIVISDRTVTADIGLVPNPGVINGNVIDTNGDPVTGAEIRVSVLNENQIVVVTLLANSDGTYTVPFLTPGTYIVTVSAPNYGSSTISATVESNQSVIVTNILTPNPVTLSVQVITTNTANPIAGATVTVRNSTNITITSGVTDQNGTITFTSLPPGVLNISATALNFGTDTISVIGNPGGILFAQLSLTSDPGNIQGFITNIANGDSIPNAAIQLYDFTNVLVQTTVSNQFGEYMFSGITPGVYTVVANAPNFGPETAGAIINSNETNTLSFALFPNPGIIQGSVRDMVNNAPIAGASIIVREFSGTGPIVFSTITDANGFFQTTTLSPKTYVLVASAEDYGTNNVSVNVISDSTTTTEILLTRDPGALQGIVRDAETLTPLPDTLVRIINDQGIIVRSLQTDVNGFYLLTSLPEGIYTVAAINPNYQSQINQTPIIANTTSVLNIALQGNPATLFGTVIDSETQSPLTGVIIEVRVSGTDILLRRVLTDQDGNYLIEGLPQGSFDVTAQMRDYAISSSTIFLTPNDAVLLNFALTPFPATIQGLVVDSLSGDPIVGALVSVVVPNTDIIIESIVTGDDGTYLIGNLPLGTYNVVFTAPNYGSTVIPVILTPNEVETVNATLQPNPATLVGTVTNVQTGIGIPGALVRVFDLNGTLIKSSLTTEAGQYTITGLSPGSYSVIASAEGFGNMINVITLSQGEVETLDFALSQEFAIMSGTVRDAASGQTIQDALVQVFRIGTEIPIGSVFTDGNGDYFITGLEPREYRVVFTAENYSSEVFRIFLEPGESRVLDVDLEANPSVIRGQVTDAVTGLPIERAGIITVLNGSGVIIASTETDQNGMYILPSLPPGTYDVIFSAEGYVTETRSIILSPNEILVLNIALDPNPGSIRGSVREEGSLTPISEALVQVFSPTGTLLGVTLTDAEGNYFITGLPGGEAVIVVRAIGYQAQIRDIIIIRGEIVTATFLLLANPATIRGIVTDRCTGEPLTGVLVQIFPENMSVPIRSTLSDVDGFYILTGLPGGTFTVRFTIDGEPVREVTVELEAGEEITLNIELGTVTLICPSNIVISNDPGVSGAIVNFPASIVREDCPNVTASCTPASGSFFPIGTTTVTCIAEDAEGVISSCSFTVKVVFDPCRYLG
ncbi:carboxypeptidase regulatory-like domain-containing protein [Metabacillus niabensis]|uniref:carboxypeptidase regulatory-like domain-containing protein n=1 Tax=Metabacillus niabensis TaxID=324854 RepID=UPI001CFAD46A|nr:carboxypeptidase regulatory-like domain-containing protein [Metabacillus niabensis]